MLIAIALAYGVSDAGNNLALNSIIGRLFDDRSEVRNLTVWVGIKKLCFEIKN